MTTKEYFQAIVKAQGEFLKAVYDGMPKDEYKRLLSEMREKVSNIEKAYRGK